MITGILWKKITLFLFIFIIWVPSCLFSLEVATLLINVNNDTRFYTIMTLLSLLSKICFSGDRCRLGLVSTVSTFYEVANFDSWSGSFWEVFGVGSNFWGVSRNQENMKVLTKLNLWSSRYIRIFTPPCHVLYFF